MNPTQKRKREAHVLTPKQQAMIEEVSRDHPSKLNTFRKAYEGVSLRAVINAKCLECTSCDKKAIRECAGTACPILNVRPYQEARS